MITTRSQENHYFPTGIVSLALATTVGLFAFIGWGSYDAYRHFKTTGIKIQNLEEVRSDIVYMDEVLSMSAFMAASTGDTKWIDRYNRYEPKLGKVIDEAIRISEGREIATVIGDIQESNDALVHMEITSFALVHQGNSNKAWALLSSDAYKLQKDIYARGIAKIVTILGTRHTLLDASLYDRLVTQVSAIALVVLLIALVWFFTARRINGWRNNLYRSQEQLKAAETRFRDFGASASDWYWEMDEGLKFSHLSDGFSKATHLGQDTMLGKNYYELGNPGVSDEDWQHHLHVLTAHQPFRNFIHPHTNASNNTIWFSINGIPVHGIDGDFKGFRGTGVDITESVIAEQEIRLAKNEAEKANHAKSEFLSTMSHELRTPLTSIMGSIGLLNGTMANDLSDEQKKLFEISLRNGDAMLLLINELLDYEKIISGTMVIKTQQHDIGALTSKVIEDNQSYANAHSVAFDYNEPGRSSYAEVQEHRFEQVLRNLLSNAAKFSSAGSKVIVSVDDHDNAIVVSVKDYGQGMPEDFKSKIFEPFTQIDSSQSRKHSGTGLGLSISKSLTECMGGKLYFESKLGVGSTFFISFPH